MTHRLALLLSLLALTVAPLSATAMVGPASAEGPELMTGAWPIGTGTMTMPLVDRWMIAPSGAGLVRREVALRYWYPAVAGAKGRPAIYRHSVKMPSQTIVVPPETGRAVSGARQAPGRYPLIILSHGFGGWNTHFSRLGEALASHGYVVVSIGHGDEPYSDVPGFSRSFGNVLLGRAQDQRHVLKHIVAAAGTTGPFGQIDIDHIGLLGYSMGGYGALATAGAAYDQEGAPFSAVPLALRRSALSPDPETAAMIKSVVLVAPWGGQPDNRVWQADALADVKQPVLMIAGDHDDVVNYDAGIRWIFDHLAASDRRMLVFREARHNVLGNAVDLGPAANAAAIGYAYEPVWRQDRINAINQHFVAAFFDLTLKGDERRRAYLDVATPVAGDGTWTVPFGTGDNGALAGDGEPAYWRGFARRWALGLEMHHHPAGDEMTQKGK
ncbi:MAG: hypothetical protein RLZZ58_111 [Pseudomonadota bacterium]